MYACACQALLTFDQVDLAPASAGGSPAHPQHAGGGGTGLAAQVGQIKAALTLDPAMPLPAAIKEANSQMGLPNEGTLPDQATALMAALGL